MTTEEPQPGPDRGGPFLKSAFLCELVLREADGRRTFVRSVNRVTHLSEEPVPFVWDIIAVIGIIPGSSARRLAVNLLVETPEGRMTALSEAPAVHEVESGYLGATLEARLRMQLTMRGWHWLHVEVNGETLTQMPFEVRYEPPGPGSTMATE